jgi:hypothetical protein
VRPVAPKAPRKRRRRAFSLNGLAIQVSAFALSFTLVALLVVGSSRAAFVEENETVTERVPVGAVDEPVPLGPGGGSGGPERSRPSHPRPSAPSAETPVPVEPENPGPPVTQLFLTDDAAGTAMFTDDRGLVPGVPEQRCIRVTIDGDDPAGPVSLYAADVQGPLAAYLDLVVETGPDGAFGDCSGFVPDSVLYDGTLADFGAGHGAFDSGLTAWEPAAPAESRSFRFTVAVRDVPEAEGLTAGFGFTWETRA